jgi:ferrochelatase
MTKTAIILFNLGGPGSQDEVKPFLLSLFSDPAILTLPQPFRSFLAHLITRRRLKEARHIYAQLGGGSPLLKNTQAQAKALETELGPNYKVFIAMRHAAPLTYETFQRVKAYYPDEVVLLPLYPHYSTTTTESSFKEWNKVAKGYHTPTHFIPSYPSQSGFIEALAALTYPHYEKAKKFGTPRVLLTAHGLPEKTIRKGDPYQHQVETTASDFIKKMGLPKEEVILCYQSRVGPLKWIGPYTDEEIIKASQERRPLVVVPISFVSEHSETLVELDITYRDLALQNGCPAYHRVETVQTHPLFIQGLAELVRGD